MHAFRLALVLAAASLLPGCLVVAAAAGAAAAYGYVQYDDNEAFRDYRADVDVAFEAGAAILRQKGYRVPEGVTFATNKGAIDVDDVSLEVTANSSISSRVHVRVGTFSTQTHKDKAASILDAIADRLGE